MKGAPKMLFITIYRPPRYSATVIDEHAELLFNLFNLHLLLQLFFNITGNFNIHLDNNMDNNAKELALLHTFDLPHNVKDSTYTRGHTLDLVISNGLDMSTVL